jgi:PAS domain S-box-containing protein
MNPWRFNQEKAGFMKKKDPKRGKGLQQKVAESIEPTDVFGQAPGRATVPESAEKPGDLYRFLIESMNDGLVLTNADGIVSFANHRIAQMLGYGPGEMVGRRATDFVDETGRRVLADQFFRRAKGAHDPYELTLRAKNGSPVHTMMSPKPILGTDGRYRGSFAVVTDITPLKKVQEDLNNTASKLRRLSVFLFEAQESEQERIYRELHDELGQDLLVLKYQLGFITRKIPGDHRQLQEACSDAVSHLDRVMEVMRRMTKELNPSVLKRVGLTSSVQRLIEDFTRHSGAHVSFDVDDHIDHLFPPESTVNVYRVFRESFTNIGKHAGARRVKVTIKRDTNVLRCFIEDDGCGFDVAKAREKMPSGQGIGLITMEARANMMGGELSIHSAPGRGTRIELSIPLKEGEIL